MRCGSFVFIFVVGRTPPPAIHSASQVDHEKRVAWFSISMHACGSLPIVIVLLSLSIEDDRHELIRKRRTFGSTEPPCNSK